MHVRSWYGRRPCHPCTVPKKIASMFFQLPEIELILFIGFSIVVVNEQTGTNVTVNEGEDIMINCSNNAQGEGQWKNEDGTDIKLSNRIKIEDNNVLVFKNSSKDDAGVYKCLRGKSIHLVNLRIRGRYLCLFLLLLASFLPSIHSSVLHSFLPSLRPSFLPSIHLSPSSIHPSFSFFSFFPSFSLSFSFPTILSTSLPT